MLTQARLYLPAFVAEPWTRLVAPNGGSIWKVKSLVGRTLSESAVEDVHFLDYQREVGGYTSHSSSAVVAGYVLRSVEQR